MFLLIRAAALALVLFAATGAAAQTAPVAIITGGDRTIDCAPHQGALVELQGSESFDPEGRELTFRWTEGVTELSTEADPTVLLSPGSHLIRLTVNDGVDPEAFAEVTITVIADTTAPVLELSSESDELWPPNHKRRPFAVADLVASVSDDCSELTVDDVVFDHATSDESDNDNGSGDGNTKDDVVFSDDCHEASVRAERAGTGDGRVYQLFLEVSDEADNSTGATFAVSVPHDRADDAFQGDDAVTYASPCGDALASCAPTPEPACALAPSAEVAMREGKKGPSLRFRAQGFAAGSVSDVGNRLCLYVDDALQGASLAPDKVKVKDKAGAGSLKLSTKGSDLEIPALPIEGDVLRVELHDADAACVAASFDDPQLNETGRYQAGTD